MTTGQKEDKPAQPVPITPDLIRRVRAWKGGKAAAKVRTDAKRKASRENGKKGGRPKMKVKQLDLKI